MDRYRFHEIEGDQEVNLSSINPTASYTQAGFYGRWQEKLGGSAKRFLVYDGENVCAYFQLVKFPLPLSNSYLYIPYGPIVKDVSDDLIASIKNMLERIAKEEKSVFVRLDFVPAVPANMLSEYFKKAPKHSAHGAVFQPRTEWFLELNKTEDELIADVQRKARWAIRASERQGVTCEIVTSNFNDYLEDFYRLMVETSGRNGFGLHPKRYYEAIFNDLDKLKGSYLSVAKYNNKILIINVVLVYNGVAMYMFSGSSSDERERNPSYLALWKAVCHARQIGCKYYNFGGVSTDSDAHKSWEGLTAFKKKFGGHEVAHSDFYDLITKPIWYHIYNLRKRIKQLRR